MKCDGIAFWVALFAVLSTLLIAGCDVDYVEYENDDGYKLLEHGVMAPPSTAEVRTALGIIEKGRPLGDISWAYSIILSSLQESVDPSEIPSLVYTAQEVEDMLNVASARTCLSNARFVCAVLRAALKESNEPGFDPMVSPKNVAIATLANSLKSGFYGRLKITRPDQVNSRTLLTHGDALVLLVSICQSSESDPNNALARIVDDTLHSGFLLKLSPFHISNFKVFAGRGLLTEVISSKQVDDSTWHLLAATFNNGTMTMYVDGEKQQSVNTRAFNIGTNNVPIRIGAAIEGSPEGQYIGMIDEVAIFNRVLSAGEVRIVYENGVNAVFDDSLILYMPLDETTGWIAHDSSVYQNDGQVFGNAQWTEGKKGKCIKLVPNSYIDVPDIPAYDIAQTASLMAWVNTSSVSGLAHLIDKTQWQDHCMPDFDVSVIEEEGHEQGRFEF